MKAQALQLQTTAKPAEVTLPLQDLFFHRHQLATLWGNDVCNEALGCFEIENRPRLCSVIAIKF